MQRHGACGPWQGDPPDLGCLGVHLKPGLPRDRPCTAPPLYCPTPAGQACAGRGTASRDLCGAGLRRGRHCAAGGRPTGDCTCCMAHQVGLVYFGSILAGCAAEQQHDMHRLRCHAPHWRCLLPQVLLVAHPYANSLPSALEALARLQQARYAVARFAVACRCRPWSVPCLACGARAFL